jgi:hypothetical protein
MTINEAMVENCPDCREIYRGRANSDYPSQAFCGVCGVSGENNQVNGCQACVALGIHLRIKHPEHYTLVLLRETQP